jgi:hypothetical protein
MVVEQLRLPTDKKHTLASVHLKIRFPKFAAPKAKSSSLAWCTSTLQAHSSMPKLWMMF